LDVVVQLMMVALFVVVAKGKWVSTSHIRGVRSVIQVLFLSFFLSFFLSLSLSLFSNSFDQYNDGIGNKPSGREQDKPGNVGYEEKAKKKGGRGEGYKKKYLCVLFAHPT